MNYLKLALTLFSLSFFTPTVFSQDLVARNGSYIVDKKNKIIVWHEKKLDSVLEGKQDLTKIKFDKTYDLNTTASALSYKKNNSIVGNTSYALYITKLPIINVALDTSKINSSLKISGFFSYFNNNKYIESTMGIRHRGNLSLSFPKKSFDIEFWTDSVSKQKKDLKFKGLRKDDDWVLDAMYNEPLHLRSFVASDLWLDIHKPYYLDKEPKAKSGFEVKFVEVFQNNEYYGIYSLSESINRKQLKLKKHAEKNILGELYKADSYKGAPAFTKAPEYNNLFPHWSGFQMRYPLIEYNADWKNVSEFVGLVVHGTDEAFKNTIEDKVHIPNVIDYYLFVNMLRASDNLGKNYFLGKYDKDAPYFFIPWDLDGVLGIIREGEPLTKTEDILSNGLFDRLLEVNPNGYKEKVKLRWRELRDGEFSNETLFTKIDKIYENFTNEKIYEREQRVWQSKLNTTTDEAHYTYLKTWLESRLSFLDRHFNSL